MRRRVVITGMGTVNPMAHDVESTWEAVKKCESGVAPITIFDAANFPTQIAAEVKDWDVDRVGEDLEDWKYAGRHSRFAVGSAKQAVESSGLLESGIEPTRVGVYLGSGEGIQDFFSFMRMMAPALKDGQLDMSKWIEVGLRILNPTWELEQEPSAPAGHVARLFNAQGPNFNCLTACAASSQALGEAVEIIRRGDADAMISGGCHSMIHPFGVTGFNLLTALSTRNDEPEKASRPFDRTATASCWAKARPCWCWRNSSTPSGAAPKSWARSSATAPRPTPSASPTSTPRAAARSAACVWRWKTRASRSTQIDYVNAHGTSTSVNDRVETLAPCALVGDRVADESRFSPGSRSRKYLTWFVDLFDPAGDLVQVDVRARPRPSSSRRRNRRPRGRRSRRSAARLRLDVDRLARDDLFLVVERLVVVDQVVVLDIVLSSRRLYCRATTLVIFWSISRRAIVMSGSRPTDFHAVADRDVLRRRAADVGEILVRVFREEPDLPSGSGETPRFSMSGSSFSSPSSSSSFFILEAIELREPAGPRDRSACR
jgi:3-oxoacyl-[acyl-carrier-protein] synthase II